MKQFSDITGMQNKDKRLLAVLVIAGFAASIIATIVLAFYGIYLFFFFIPIAFGLPWSIKRIWKSRARRQWNVEDLR